MVGLTSAVHGIITAGPLIRLTDWASTGTTPLDEGNFADTTTIIIEINGYLT